ncbi:phage tail protein [Streptomyces sp. NBC_01003]|uniref:phage tail protein n=1 Tax=Streptomyces sp. NBC_01003 TaxID=2903714 RepID=UPI003869D189|nr:phage tail protein [Streptomyces sp. NBC_01003]
MPESSYLRHLPPVLWKDAPQDSGFSLGSTLCVFEKILTGIDDDVPVLHTKHTQAGDENDTHLSIAERIALLDRLFDPWTTPPEFLPWLASWVSLRFPELQGRQLWDEYQRRKATAEISKVHSRRGLRSGLTTFLDLYSVGKVRPRVAVDDGSSLFVAHIAAGVPAPVSALSPFRPLLDETDGLAVEREGLLRPWCVARGPDGSLFAGDRGLPADLAPGVRRQVWRLDATTGQPDLAGSPPLPRPLAPQQMFGQIIAVAVGPARAGRPETLFILDSTGKIFSLPAPYTADTATELTRLTPGSGFPLAMAVDDQGDLLVLDRGLQPEEVARPKVFVVRPAPLSVTVKDLDPALVTEPLSLFVDHDGTLIIGDGGDREAPPLEHAGGGNLVRIVRGGTEWTHTRLLPPQNPLVAPTAVTRTGADGLYVLDAGLRPFWPSATEHPFILHTAWPAVVVRVETAPGATAGSTLRVTEPGHFVNPTGMTAHGKHLIICDPGQIESSGVRLDGYRSRFGPFDINVVIHFSRAQLSADPVEQRRELSQAVGTIKSIVRQHMPAHCRFNEVTMTEP